MKTNYLIALVGLLCFFPFTGTLKAQVGNDEPLNVTVAGPVEDHTQRIADLEEKVKVADALVKRAKRYEKTAKRNAREAKAALKYEKQAVKTGKRSKDRIM